MKLQEKLSSVCHKALDVAMAKLNKSNKGQIQTNNKLANTGDTADIESLVTAVTNLEWKLNDLERAIAQAKTDIIQEIKET